MKKTILVAMLATTIFACSTPGEKTASTDTAATSSCVKEGPDVDLMNKAITAYSAGDWATWSSCFSDTAKSWHNDDSVGLSVSDRVEMFKKQREAVESVDSGTPNYEVVTVATTDKQYEGYKWGHAWVTFVAKTKAGQTMKTRAFAAFAIKDGKIHWEQVIYDAK